MADAISKVAPGPEALPEAQASAASEASAYPSARTANYTLALLALAVLIAFANRQVLILLVDPIRADLNIGDGAIGSLQGIALYLTYGIGALLCGKYVDKHNRRNILIVCILLWTLFSALTGFAQNYAQMFVFRMGVGLAESVVLPISYSMIGDLYPPRQRVKANVAFFAATLIGVSIGLSITGGIVNLVSTEFAETGIAAWRLSFLAVASPGFLLALIFLTCREPRRIVPETEAGAVADKASLWAYLGQNRSTIIFLFTGFVLAEFAINAAMTWTPTVLVRSYGIAVEGAGVRFGTAMTIASITSVAIAFLLTRNAKFSRDAQLMALTVIICFVLSSALLALSSSILQANAFLVVMGAFFAIGLISGPLAPTLILAVAPGRMRGQVMGAYTAYSLIAQSAAPVLIGWLSDNIFTDSDGIHTALIVTGVPILGFAALLLICARGPMRQTLARLDPVDKLS